MEARSPAKATSTVENAASPTSKQPRSRAQPSDSTLSPRAPRSVPSLNVDEVMQSYWSQQASQGKKEWLDDVRMNSLFSSLLRRGATEPDANQLKDRINFWVPHIIATSNILSTMLVSDALLINRFRRHGLVPECLGTVMNSVATSGIAEFEDEDRAPINLALLPYFMSPSDLKILAGKAHKLACTRPQGWGDWIMKSVQIPLDGVLEMTNRVQKMLYDSSNRSVNSERNKEFICTEMLVRRASSLLSMLQEKKGIRL